MRRLLALVSLFVSLLVSALSLAPSASAETVRGSDAEADVRYYDYRDDDGGDDDGGDDEGDEDPGVVVDRPTVDLTGYRVTYATTRIQVVMRYQDLQEQGPARFFAGLIIEYPRTGGETGEAELEVTTTPGNRAGRSEFSDLSDSEGGKPCATRHRIDYDRNQVTISMPSSCLGKPRYVDVFAGTYLTDVAYSRYYVDVAPGDGRRDGVDGEETVRVRRG